MHRFWVSSQVETLTKRKGFTMKKLSLSVLAGFTLSYLPAQAASDAVVSIGSSCLNFRSKATGRSYVKDCLDSGTKVKVLKSNSRYSYVQVGNQKGYVWNNYLKSAPAATTASVSSAAPAATDDFSDYSLPQDYTKSVVTTASAEKSQGRLSEMFIQDMTPRLSSNVVDQVQKSLPPDAAPTRQDSSPIAQAPAAAATKVPGADLASLSWNATQFVSDNVIGRGNGYSMRRAPGWAKLNADGSVYLKGSKSSHCTSATHAQFLTTIGELHKKGLIQLNEQSIAALNSNLFRDAWNSNGYANGKLMEILGGQSFTDKSLAKKGDFMKMDRSNGSGHTTIFSHFEGNKVCFWSSNGSTRGPGVKCESMSGKTLTFSRINDLQGLQAGLDNLENELRSDLAFKDVRRRGGNGFVDKDTLEIASASTLKSSPSIVNGSGMQYADASKPRRSYATASAGGTF